MSALLEVDGVRAGYGDFEALHGVSARVDEGETLAIIGANGAGKSTLLKAVAGAVPLMAGQVAFDGRPLKAAAPHERVLQGIVLVPEGRRLFRSLTVRENLLLGAYRKRPGPWTLERVLALFPMLEDKLDRHAGRLSGGEQQAVAIGRGLMANPRLLLLDEVSLGLAPIIVKQLYADLPKIREAGTTVLVVEQDVAQAQAVCDRLSCLLTGTVSLEGRPQEFSHEDLRRAYFGLEG
ncbi:MAG: Branched-chain amino acid transport ATP-binding protein LivF [uncultured Solirubrobacteraceae bacterium]|uniref:Branched-chain amino acid transport ATP-binding protein LivF n=1 Tax=uncultured Solirubrobacteraceae bacterium TaxID=1162706 RepID=A0A6J4SSK1_9ACTN|nr:MAG: Branched-chain amino acid transport ATP-binding protein LivF [uncultured Solirubrobacteraceae bacterium]